MHPTDRDILRRLKRKVDNIRGPGVVHTPDAVLISRPSPTRPPPVRAEGVGSSLVFARIDGTEAGRGKYSGRLAKIGEVSPTEDGVTVEYGDFVLLVNLGERASGPTHALPLNTIVGPCVLAGRLDIDPPEGSPDGTPRDTRPIALFCADGSAFRAFRLVEQSNQLKFQGSHAVAPTEDSHWITLIDFDPCPPA